MNSKQSRGKRLSLDRPLIRRFEEKDRKAIRKICSDAALEKPHPQFQEDPEQAPLYFTDYYLDYEPESCFVCEVDGCVAGYLVGCKDTLAFHRIFRNHFLPRIMARIGWKLLTLQYRKKETYQMLWWMLAERFQQTEKLSIPLDKYPAHTHLNIVPEYRGYGFSNQLSKAFRQHLREIGVTGLHAVIIEKADDDSLFNRFSGRRNYKLLAIQRHTLLEKMTGEKWQLKLIVTTLNEEREFK
jgi:hypothetical protein